MSSYFISKVDINDKRSNQLVEQILISEGIRRDRNLDYTCAIYDQDMNIIATGSCFGNTLRCLSVANSHRGEGFLNILVTHLIEVQHERGNHHLFIYTKMKNVKYFKDMGFFEIAHVEDEVAFMENKKDGFNDYLISLADSKRNTTISAAVVLNANPFTNGHLYLVEKAAAESEVLHLFVVSEDASLVPYSVRKKLVIEGTRHINNIVYHETGSYIISSSTFPSYFQEDETSVIRGQAKLDIAIFCNIAKALNITRRYVGEEPKSRVTRIYNETMQIELPKNKIECVIVPRKLESGKIISASTVRLAIKEDDFHSLALLVPKTTFRYFTSEAAAPIIRQIKGSNNVIHY